jgi:predicted secreted protein with PEFG-CTERM motif
MYNKVYGLMAILMASVASVTLVGAAFAQAPTLTVQTDKGSYTTGDAITVTGKLAATNMTQPIYLQVTGPKGTIVRADPGVTPNAAGSYTYTFPTGGVMKDSGEYTVTVTYKGTTSAKSTFQFTASGETWKTFNIKVGNQNFPVQYMITGGTVKSMVPDEKTATLTITVNSTAEGNLQIRLPRNVIDAREGTDGKSGNDSDFAVFADEENVAADESDTTVDRRTLSIDLPQGTETVEIVGTWAIPEFGAIAAIILAVAIVGIIVVTATYSKKLNFAPRL